MDDIFLIEIRLGKTKWRIKQAISAIAARFRLDPFIERHPHVTIFGPLTLNEGISPQDLLDTIGQVACRYDPVPFMIDGWEKREGMHGSVIAFPVRPSGTLKSLTTAIASVLAPIGHSHNLWDAFPDKKWFHVTIANRLDPRKAEKVFSRMSAEREGPYPPGRSRAAIFSWLTGRLRALLPAKRQRGIRPLTLDETGLRITVLQGETILAEYDLLGKRWIFGGADHSSRSWQDTLTAYRRASGFERTVPIPPSGTGGPFLIADLHLGHANIIRYCARPFFFPDPAEMDRVLVQNWNCTVSPESRVYYLGDLRYGTHAQGAGEYRKNLQGDITFITGNHDDRVPGSIPSSMLEYQGFRFLLVHDPADTPRDFDGWVIHGHHHNNDLRHYPFINIDKRRINVSAEVIGYAPVSLDAICRLLRSRLASGDTSPVLLSYPAAD